MATILFTYVLVVKLNICHFNKKRCTYKKKSNYPVILSNLSINIFFNPPNGAIYRYPQMKKVHQQSSAKQLFKHCYRLPL